MSIKSKRITIRIFATFLILSLTLCYFTIGVSASDYSVSNDTVYKSADYWGLEELPYGVDTGVVQFQYEQGYLTLYFDKLSIYDDDFFDINPKGLYTESHYWNVLYDDSSGTLDYSFSCASDSPIYYKKSYAENGVFSSSFGTLTEVEVKYPYFRDGEHLAEFRRHQIWLVEDKKLSSLVPDWTISSNSSSRRVFSNCYQVDTSSIYFLKVYRAAGATNWVNGNNVGYNVEYYPSVEYLQNVSLRQSILDEFWKVRTELIDINNHLYNVNVYIEQMYYLLYDVDTFVVGIHSVLDTYLPLIDYNLGQVLEKLNEIKTGPEYDSSQGIGSNTEFGDSVGGLIGNTQVPDSGVSSVKSNLSKAFLCIRTIMDSIMFDWFPLGYVITFLLGMSFIAYVLGRVIKNKMN